MVEFLQKENPGSCDLMSLDVEDMFYSMPHSELMKAVEECIDMSGSVAFTSSAGITIDSFLKLLRFYLASKYVTFEDLQKSGIRIKSSVAPVLSDIYLAKCDRGIAKRKDERILKTFRYVDDYLIVLIFSQGLGDNREVVTDMVDLFSGCSPGLRFKPETPSEGAIQFLNLSLKVQASHICWPYEPWSKKGY